MEEPYTPDRKYHDKRGHLQDYKDPEMLTHKPKSIPKMEYMIVCILYVFVFASCNCSLCCWKRKDQYEISTTSFGGCVSTQRETLERIYSNIYVVCSMGTNTKSNTNKNRQNRRRNTRNILDWIQVAQKQLGQSIRRQWKNTMGGPKSCIWLELPTKV